MQKEFEILEFVQHVDFEFIVWLKKNGLNYWIIFDDSCEENFHSKDFVITATAEGHC